MVTGDNLETAIAIAKEAGIILAGSDQVQGGKTSKAASSSRFRCMTGYEFRKHFGGLKEEIVGGEKREVIANVHAFREIIKELRVLARSTPMDKYILVTGLRNEGNVVAVTGDGTNDAPALKKANVGFAMGIAGTEVAKEAADIILLDDNFGSIVTAIKWGRNVYDSIRKFLQFQLTVNLVAMTMALVGGIFLGESPLNPIQMLWVNLIMDTFAALALATEPPKEEIIRGKPYGKNENILNAVMWRNVIGQAFFQMIILGVFLFAGDYFMNIEKRNLDEPWTVENGLHFTLFFNIFVFL
jgi:Ca2+ transporting ATPase